MFGYITPLICELKVCEYELFKAYYCGLCKALKKGYRRTAVLNYDCTFIYALGDSLRYADTDVRKCKCALHPGGRRTAVYSQAAAYAADVNILMAYAKAKDDKLDGGGVLSAFPALALKKPFERAAERLPGITRDMLQMAEELRGMERRGSANTDEVADTYARLFGNVLMELDVTQSHILYEIGYSLGRWVYLIDAYDDIEKDIKSGQYNVFVNKYGIKEAAGETARQEIYFGFNFTLSKAMQALKRLELKKNRGLMQNIICLGIREKTKLVMGMEAAPEGKEPDESVSGVGR